MMTDMEKNRLQGVNIAAVLMIASMSFITAYNYTFETPDRYINLGVLCYLLTLPLLNKFKFHFIGKLSATFIFPLLVLYLSLMFGEESRLFNLLVLVSISPFLLYDSLLLKISNLSYVFLLQVIDIILSDGTIAPFENQNNKFNIIVVVAASAIFIGVLFNFLFSEFYRFNREQYQLRKAVESKNESLEREVAINKEKNELFATLAHDLKGPARSISKFTKQVNYLVENNDFESLRKLSAYNHISGENISYTVNNLLDWALSQMEEFGHHPTYFELIDSVTGVIDQLKYISTEKEITIVNKVSSGIVVFFEFSDLQVIVRNILHNSHKYSQNGSSIEIISRLHELGCSLSIKDFGPGLNSEDIEVIRNGATFNFQMSQNKNRGYGIGLATCYKLLKKNNADWSIESSSRGTTFTLHIS